MEAPSKDSLIGRRFGQLVVIDVFQKFSGNQVRKFARCACTCGKQKDICGYSLERGNTTSCGCYAKAQRLLGTSKYNYNTQFFREAAPEAQYTLGLILTDGNLHRNKNIFSITLHQEDIHVLKQVGFLVRGDDTLHFPVKSNCVTLYCTNSELYSDLCGLGFTPNKSTSTSIPTQLQSSSHFWRGVIDGDGSLFISGNYLYLSMCGTRAVCQSFLDCTRSIGIQTKAKVRPKKGYSFEFCETQLSGTAAYRFAKFIYQDAGNLRIDRKYQAYWSYKQMKYPNE